LEEFVASEAGDAPFLNSFPQPVYFDGLPFDISFICPDMDEISPAAVLRIIISRYDASNNLLASTVTDVDPTGLVGRVCSLTIDPDAIENNAAYITAQIEIATP
jgi:hypothetical protein